MKKRFFFWMLNLVAILLVVSCAPVSTAQDTVVFPPTASDINSVLETETTIPTIEATNVSSTEVPAVQAIATSRGPDLHATDPTTVSLASGQLQLVEFFRFT